MASRPQLVPCLLAAIMLLLALGEHPYGYYQALRWVVFAAAMIVAWVGYRVTQGRDGESGWVTAVVFCGFAVLFNPFAPITETRGFWQPWDVIAAIAFALACALKVPASGRSTSRD